MPIEFPDLMKLPAENVAAARALLIQQLQEKAPTADFRRGVIHDLLLNLESIVHAAQETYADKFRKSGSIQAIEADPSLADDSLVDAVLSNFLITRKIGRRTYGAVTIVLNESKATAIAAGTVLTAFGNNYTVTNTFAARTSINSVITESDRIIFEIGDGTYGFNVDVEAVEVGERTQLKQGDKLQIPSLTSGATGAFAASDFIQGSDVESNLELIQRLKEGVSSRNFSNKYALSSLIKGNFSSVKDVSCLGYGAPEQIRYHGLFPVAHGGRVDACVRNAGIPYNMSVDTKAKLVEQRLAGGLWQVSFTRETAPGFYEATRIVKLADKNNSSIVNGYETVNIIRGFDLEDDGTGFSPDVETANEAAFTRYQTCTIQFLDTDTFSGLELGSEADYTITLRLQVGLDSLQSFLNSPETRPSGSDILVRATSPFDVRISVVIHNRNKDFTVPIDAIKEGLYVYVNSLGFSSKLYESNLISIIQNALTEDQSIDSIDLRGRLLYPNGRIRYINGRVSLTIPEDPLNLVTPRTTSYFLNKSDIQISVQSV